MTAGATKIYMQTLNDVQFKILDSLYFVESYDTLLEEVGEPAAVITDELRTLIDKGLVQVMAWDEETKDYKRSIMYDADDMRAFQYLVTKNGLSLHTQSQREQRAK